MKIDILKTENDDGTWAVACLVDDEEVAAVSGVGDLWTSLTALNALVESQYDVLRAAYVATRGAYEAEGRRTAEAAVTKVRVFDASKAS